jgi:hypothetical protein
MEYEHETAHYGARRESSDYLDLYGVVKEKRKSAC